MKRIISRAQTGNHALVGNGTVNFKPECRARVVTSPLLYSALRGGYLRDHCTARAVRAFAGANVDFRFFRGGIDIAVHLS